MQRVIRGVVVLRYRSDVAPGHCEIQLDRRLPGRTGNVAPARVDRLAGEAEIPCAIVGMSPGERCRLEVLQVRPVESEQHTAEVGGQPQLIRNLHVHTAYQGSTDVDVRLLDITPGGNGIASEAAG